MPPRTYAVIGSNCFTGSHIVDALLSDPDHQVIGISRAPEYPKMFLPYKRWSAPRFTFHQIDVIERFDTLVALLDHVQPQVVINVAALSEVAVSNERPVEYFDTNTLGVVRLCNQLRTRAYLQHYVHISSAEIFGSCDAPVSEASLYNPSTPYAVSKAAADLYLETLRRNYHFPAIIIRSTNVYGAHQQLYKIIPRTILSLKSGRIIQLHGGGRAIKSFIHIRDVVRGIIYSMARGTPDTYHFSVASDRSIAEIVHLICTMMGYDFNAVTAITGERLGQDGRYVLNCSKAHAALGWQPQISFEDGLREVLSWIEAHGPSIGQAPHEYIHRVSKAA